MSRRALWEKTCPTKTSQPTTLNMFSATKMWCWEIQEVFLLLSPSFMREPTNRQQCSQSHCMWFHCPALNKHGLQGRLLACPIPLCSHSSRQFQVALGPMEFHSPGWVMAVTFTYVRSTSRRASSLLDRLDGLVICFGLGCLERSGSMWSRQPYTVAFVQGKHKASYTTIWLHYPTVLRHWMGSLLPLLSSSADHDSFNEISRLISTSMTHVSAVKVRQKSAISIGLLTSDRPRGGCSTP